jgi:diguanylate cyclase (GGDEF)-like protein
MRTQVAGLVVFTSLIGLVLALLVGEYYRHLMRDSLAHVAALRAQELLQQEESAARDFALGLQQLPGFRSAWKRRSRTTLQALLAPVAVKPPGSMKLLGLHLLDSRLRTVARVDHDPGGDGLCAALLTRLRERAPVQRTTPMSALCAAATHVHHVTVVAIGGARPGGYVAVVTDPAPALKSVEHSVGMPLRLRVGGNLLFASPGWTVAAGDDELLVATTALDAWGAAPPLLELAAGAGELGERLHNARVMVLLFGGTATLGVVWLSLWVLNRCTLRPLARLTERMRLVRNDRSLLGTGVTPCGNAEMRELAENFNDFSAELKELQSNMESLAYNDTLTGLPNRLMFRDRLEQQILLSRREGLPFAVCLADLDRFKEINDTRGHHVGDLLLQQVGLRLKRALRKSDTLAMAGNTLARLGGDEFCALLPAVKNAEDAAVVAGKILSALHEPFEIEGHPLRVGISVGLALYPLHAESAERLCRCADVAMYQAKRNGTGFAVHDAESVATAAAS